MRINLSGDELEICRKVGSARTAKFGSSKWKMGKQDQEQMDIDGMIGKFAACLYFGVAPDLTADSQPDGADLITKKGATVDVKSTRWKNGHLLAILNKKSEFASAEYYVLMIVDDHGADLAGWIKKEDLFIDANISDMGHGSTYAVHRSKLTKLKARKIR